MRKILVLTRLLAVVPFLASAGTIGEAVNSSSLNWTTGGDAGWFVQSSDTHDGQGAVRSGAIGNSQSSWIQTTVSGAKQVSFWWKVSSESNYDFLKFYVDGVEKKSISGTSGWSQETVEVTGTGTHILKWQYSKDGSVSSGSDCGWVDQVVISNDSNDDTFTQEWAAVPSAGGWVDNGGSHDVGTVFNLRAIPNSGYTFAGWYVDAACTYALPGSGSNNYLSNPFKMQAGACDFVVYAKFSEIQSNVLYVNFDANGGDCSTSSRTVNPGSSVGTLPTATWSGREFLGWFTSASGGTKISASTKVNSSVTYYAHWERKVGPADDYLFVENDGDVETEVGEYVAASLDMYFYVDSGSEATITLSGLPSGLSYNKNTGAITGQTKKRGVCYVTCSAKNKQGYQMSSMIKWTVGEVEDADYDDIGLPSDLLEDLCTGREVLYCELPSMTVSGLPTGLKFPGSGCRSDGLCVDCMGEYLSGIPTRAGKFVVRFTEKGTNRKAQKTVIVRDGGSAYQIVSVGEGAGTVSGGGVKASGATVKLSAKAASGCYFAGWYTDSGCSEPFHDGNSGDYRTANESFVFNAEEVQPLYARFVTKAEDVDIDIYADDVWNVETGYGSDYFWFEVESLTKPTVTAKGLPAGVKLSGTSLVIADTSKLKPGTSLVTLTAKNLSGATVMCEVRVVVPNLQSWVFDGIDYEGSYTYTVGMSDVCYAPWTFYVEEGWTVTASGVPSGMKFNFDKQNGYAYLSGMAKKAGVYTVTLTAKKGSQTEKATFTVEVMPFPEDAVGTYGGDIGYDLADGGSDDGIGYDIYSVGGSFSMTIAKDGKISVKFPANGKTISLSGYSCDVSEEQIEVYLYDTKEENWCSLFVYLQRGLGDYQVEGSFGSLGSEWSALGQRNVAKADSQMKTMVAKLTKLGKIQGVAQYGYIACPGCILSEVGGVVKPNVTFAVGADGQVKASGKIDGRSVSGTALLQVCETEDDWLMYADFYDYKSNTGLLVYRAVFSWNWLSEYYPTASSALYDGAYYTDGGAVACKPVVYLYPETETVCSVKVDLDGKLTYTYPEHGKAGWQSFVASPDGTLTFADRSQYYCLFWEGQMKPTWDFSQGYCVKGSETASFLADVLLKMGLSFREANEFIIYWLPQMQDNPHNVIAFQGEEYTNAARLEISPSPDSLLRVFMAWYPSARPVDITAPVIEPFERKGFTVIEWGGTKVDGR